MLMCLGIASGCFCTTVAKLTIWPTKTKIFGALPKTNLYSKSTSNYVLRKKNMFKFKTIECYNFAILILLICNVNLKLVDLLLKNSCLGVHCLAQLVELATLDLRVVSYAPCWAWSLFKKKKEKNSCLFLT